MMSSNPHTIAHATYSGTESENQKKKKKAVQEDFW